MERLTRAREAENKYIREQNDLEISKAKEMADIDTNKFKSTVAAIGADTIKAIAVSGPEMQVRSISQEILFNIYNLEIIPRMGNAMSIVYLH